MNNLVFTPNQRNTQTQKYPTLSVVFKDYISEEISPKCWGILKTVHKLEKKNYKFNVMLPEKDRGSMDGIKFTRKMKTASFFLLVSYISTACLTFIR